MPPFGGLTGNVHGLSMARWKACGRLSVSANLTFFQLSWLRRYERIFVERWVGYFERRFPGGRGHRPSATLGVRKLESLGYHVVLFP